ncbi:RluA family pseudouridine synthase [Orrella marina]|uniref:Pseudouridine synthase n=1 Tax=Orrella marina TaxID=2163011 RepID=A0A2R4XJ27_9BURK|nr:RluA family pseudouridine synthase [Orrella marina]AWB33826.1 RluA family pseudouridine synthase [Orrella marina]
MHDSSHPEDLSDEFSIELEVPSDVLGVRLDKQLSLLLNEHSRARLQTWIESGHVRVNGVVQTRSRFPVSGGDVLTVTPQACEQESAYTPQPVEFEVVQEQEQWIVVNKPAGLVVHPGAGNWSHTLLNGLLFRYPELAGVARAGIVHRLDKDTSGLMVVARTDISQTSLVRQLQARTVSRQYLAITHGHLIPLTGRVDRPIGRDARVAVRMTVQRPIAPKEAITDYAVERTGQADGVDVSQVQCALHTGRTHQIRVHLASLGHPLVADVLYGGRELGTACRQMLHARKLSFEDPVSQQKQSFESPLPADMERFLGQAHWKAT